MCTLYQSYLQLLNVLQGLVYSICLNDIEAVHLIQLEMYCRIWLGLQASACGDLSAAELSLQAREPDSAASSNPAKNRSQDTAVDLKMESSVAAEKTSMLSRSYHDPDSMKSSAPATPDALSADGLILAAATAASDAHNMLDSVTVPVTASSTSGSDGSLAVLESGVNNGRSSPKLHAERAAEEGMIMITAYPAGLPESQIQMHAAASAALHGPIRRVSGHVELPLVG